MSDTATCQACPNRDCESSDIHPMAGNINKDSDPDNRWRCGECGNKFDTPIRRPAREGSTTDPPSHSLASTLSEMDSSEIGESA